MTAVLLWLGKSALCLTIGLLMLPWLRRASAANRHAVLAASVLLACLMPVLIQVAPHWPVLSARLSSTSPMDASQSSVLGDDAAGTSGAVVTTTVRAADGRGPMIVQWALALWGAATLLLLVRIIRSRRALATLLREARPLDGAPADALTSLAREWGIRRPLRLLVHPSASLVAVAGVFRPRIVVPAAAAAWTRDRWQIVLRHELAHVRRWDLLWHEAAQLTLLLQPWNPLAWLAARRLRDESEQACDDVVIASGVAPADYATHLLQIATPSTSPLASHVAASSIAHPSTLERRVRTMLQPRTNHHSMTRTSLALAVGVSLIVGLPIASATTAAEPIAAPAVAVIAPAPAPPAVPAPAPAPAPSPVVARPVVATRTAVTPTEPTPAPVVVEQLASIAGRIVDETGGVIPGANVTVKDQAGNTNQVYTRATGQFAFSDLQPGPYELTITLPGFKTAVARLTLVGGTTSEPLITLAVGALSEQITVTCSAPTALDSLARLLGDFMPTLHAQAAQTPIRVGGNVRAPKRTHYVQPACPAGVGSPEATVVLSGTIDMNGRVDAAVAPGVQAPIDAVNAALDAVRRWEYTPTQLNGKPVAVDINVTLRFVK